MAVLGAKITIFSHLGGRVALSFVAVILACQRSTNMNHNMKYQTKLGQIKKWQSKMHHGSIAPRTKWTESNMAEGLEQVKKIDNF